MSPPSSHAEALTVARQHAEAGRFDDFLTLCWQVTEMHRDDLSAQLDLGALLSSYGCLSDARACYEKAQTLAPTDLRARVNLANLARDAGKHDEASRLYTDLLVRLPNHNVIRRNALTSLEYDPEVTDTERFTQAKAWGEWAITQAGGPQPRPGVRPLKNRSLRLGYVSADFCQHTVGLFLRDVLKAHDPQRLRVFAYSAGQVKDWVTDEIRAACQFRDIGACNDSQLAQQIREDRIDVLVDLSGHTGGSRLSAFAHRPAPVMVSWLGYFATTGLPYMDAVLLDEWHAPPGTEAQFVEPIIRLPAGRFCYQPVPWVPAEVAPPPLERNGHITFGCFNNTAKFNDGVFDLWARVLHAVPDAQLILKWRTFNDETFRQKVTQAFVNRGIAAERIELRGPSFHADLLKEYADLDIALDPFPFTGGLTSCEALWMGVPVVTWPQSRVVSRQTYAFLNQIGLPELAAQDADDYVRIAAGLVNDRKHLAHLRATLREQMRVSPLMDAAGFARQLEETLLQHYYEVQMKMSTASPQNIFLNVGAGHPKSGARRLPYFEGPTWKEVRLDIDPANEPDILGSMLDMSSVASESVDVIYSSHNIEHLYPNEISQAMNEFLRVLKPEGYAIIACPDLQAAARMIAEDKLMDVAYNSPAGPVTPFDIVFSHRMFTGRSNPYMAHHCGFTLQVLIATLRENGFSSVAGRRREASFELWVVATKQPWEDSAIRELAAKVLPS